MNITYISVDYLFARSMHALKHIQVMICEHLSGPWLLVRVVRGLVRAEGVLLGWNGVGNAEGLVVLLVLGVHTVERET